MLSSGIVIAAGLLWLGLLFGVAIHGERRSRVIGGQWPASSFESVRDISTPRMSGRVQLRAGNRS